MRALVQRVKSASVSVDEKVVGAIDRGFLILLGVGSEDGEEDAEKLWRKIEGLRIFPDSEGKINLSLNQVNGNVLVVSQFTLWANCRRGKRPSFIEAAAPDKGEALYEYFLALVRAEFPDAASGQFGASMEVSLINEGPFTIWLDTDEL